MQAKFYGMCEKMTHEFESYCRRVGINIVIDHNADDSADITLNTIEEQCIISTKCQGENINIIPCREFLAYNALDFTINSCDFERLTII